MSNKTVIDLGSKVLSFDFGEFSLDYRTTDKKDAQIQDVVNMNDKEGRKALKPMVDEFFVAMFDEDAPQKIYEVAGENTWNYLNVFLQVSATIQKEWKKKLNDENFKKYLAE